MKANFFLLTIESILAICKYKYAPICCVHITLPRAICKWWSNRLQTRMSLRHSSWLPSCPTNMPCMKGPYHMSRDNVRITTTMVLMHWVCNLYQGCVHDVLRVKGKTSCIIEEVEWRWDDDTSYSRQQFMSRYDCEEDSLEDPIRMKQVNGILTLYIGNLEDKWYIKPMSIC